ncbi:hypothetical protein SAY86_009375 [Trapa natans]|uniref:Uncharacterized protein n=1 Tax=Trapa natans TaxID=22666 RepID=A0AAN7QSZ4_TRANT|nr:hypothetical protein SAY86_009375 [Trapa natans]
MLEEPITMQEVCNSYIIHQSNKSVLLGESTACGYGAGVFCPFMYYPADNLVPFFSNAKGATIGDASVL